MEDDSLQDLSFLEPIVAVMKQMLDKIAAMDEEIDALSKLVNEEIIGGITNLYNSKQRMSGVGCLQEKYGKLMGPYKDFYSDLTNGHDMYEELYDELDEVKKSAEDWNDEREAEYVSSLVDELKSRLDKMNGHVSALKTSSLESGSIGDGEKKPAAVEISVSKMSGAPSLDTDALKEKIRQMKAKSGPIKF